MASPPALQPIPPCLQVDDRSVRAGHGGAHSQRDACPDRPACTSGMGDTMSAIRMLRGRVDKG